MATFVVGEKVRLSQARGGWEGFIFEVRQDGPKILYVVRSPNDGDRDEGTQVVDEVDITVGGLTIPTWINGQNVTLYRRGGTIVAVNADFYDIDIEIVMNKHMTVTRHHVNVHASRLALENPI